MWETKLEKYWAELVLKLLFDPCDSYIQIRKFHCNYCMTIPAEIFNTGIEMGYSMMGYGNDKSKGTQLTRNYFNEEELEGARESFKERLNSKTKKNVQSCISARMGNVKKDSRSQGFCMQSITINHLKNDECGEETLYIDMYYRTTEVVQKFLADLKFLQEKVIPFILDGVDVPLTGVRFHFSSVYVSLMFFPVLYRGENMLSILKQLEKHDAKYFRQALGAADKLMKEENTYNYQVRAKQHDFFRVNCANHYTPTLTKQILEYIKKKRKK